MPRSGTTLLSLMLDTHSRISVPNESHFIPKYYRYIESTEYFSKPCDVKGLVSSILDEPYVKKWDKKVNIDDLDLSQCTNLANIINQIFLTYAKKNGKDIWIDKTPSHINDIHILNKLFPSCKFIHIVRDGRDVALSLQKQYWGPDDFMSCIKFWREKVLVATKMLYMLPKDRQLEVKYEKLVISPRQELKRITDFLELDFEVEMITEYRKNAKRKVGKRINNIHKNLLKKPLISNAFRWKTKLSRADQAIAFEYAHDLFELFGYENGVEKSFLKAPKKIFYKIIEHIRWRYY